MHGEPSSFGSPYRKNFFLLPVVLALLVQTAAFAIVLALAYALPILINWQLRIAIAALLQGGIAAFLSRALRLAPWWMLIQFVFPVAFVTMVAVALPSSIYLGVFLVLLCLYWTTFRTQVPYYPSTMAVWRAVAGLLSKGRRLRVIDIGSGFGGLVMHLAEEHPNSEIVGVELAPMPWICSLIRARWRRSTGRFVRGDYEALDFGEYDIVFAYLSPAAMCGLWCKACAEMHTGSLLLSYEFIVPGVDPDVIVHPTKNGPAIFGWKIK